MTSGNKIRSRDYDRLKAFGLLKGKYSTELERARRAGREPSTVEKAVDSTANNIASTIRDQLDSFLTDKERAQFASKMWYYLGGIMSYVGMVNDELHGLSGEALAGV